jgi:processing peptidase subunit alpha
MYSRLYTHILNHFPQIDHCASFHHIYTDSSLFGLFASFTPVVSGHEGGSKVDQVLPHLVHQLSLLLYTPIPEVELKRAKNQLKSSMVMALESQAVEVEDLGRQVQSYSPLVSTFDDSSSCQILVHNRKIPVSEMMEKIDEVNTESVRRVATRIFGPQSGRQATVVTMGREDVPDWPAVFHKYGVAGAS